MPEQVPDPPLNPKDIKATAKLWPTAMQGAREGADMTPLTHQPNPCSSPLSSEQIIPNHSSSNICRSGELMWKTRFEEGREYVWSVVQTTESLTGIKYLML